MATLTITTDPAVDARMQPAFGDMLRLGRIATGPEIKQAIIDHMKSVVFNYEARQNVAALLPPGPRDRSQGLRASR